MRAFNCAWWAAVLLMTVAWGCSSDSKDGENAAPSGGLPCNGPSVDCRLAFSGDYTGTFEGGDTGTLTIYVNVIGGMEGTAKGGKLASSTISGQVDEFGKMVFTAGDAEFTGQFKADHSFSGTWKGAAGTGTFSGGVGSATGSGGGGSGGSSGNGSGLLAEARAACQATLKCEGAPADCSKVEAAPPGCETLEHAMYDCVKAAGCSFGTACSAQTEDLLQCVLFGTQPDPGTGYAPSGNDTYDEATVICAACQAEATACHDLPACWDYAVCAEACPSGETYCVDNCATANPAGHDAWFDATWCDSNNCFGL
jgi:hypothetical protein